MGNKSSELDCLNLAIQHCLKQHGISKRIGRLLSGDDVAREDDERPDFLRLCKPIGCPKNILVGIEHFRVDHYSEKKSRQRVSSKAVLYEKNVRSAVETWQPKIKETEGVPDGALEDISSILAQAMEQRIQATYHSFIESFKYSLDKHLQAVDYYHATLDRYVGVDEKKLVFLIEIHSDFRTLFFHDRKGIHHNAYVCPFFDDLIKIMETIDTRRVQYIVLCFGGIVYNDNTTVIAVPTRNLRSQLEKQHIPIYHYAGHDVFLQGFQTPRLNFKAQSDYEKNGDNITFCVSITSKEIKADKKLEMVVGAYKIIRRIREKKQNYATTDIVEMFCDVWGEFCEGIADKPIEEIMALWPLINSNNENAIYENYVKHKAAWE